MPKEKEIELKFVVHHFTPTMIPYDALITVITQDYLMEHGGMERRVRKSMTCADLVVTYTYTEKTPTDVVGVRIENEKVISKEDYYKYLGKKNPNTRTIRKDRYTFLFKNQKFEMDIYISPISNLVILEVEIPEISKEVLLPLDWWLEDVTGNPLYSNRTIAQK